MVVVNKVYEMDFFGGNVIKSKMYDEYEGKNFKRFINTKNGIDRVNYWLTRYFSKVEFDCTIDKVEYCKVREIVYIYLNYDNEVTDINNMHDKAIFFHENNYKAYA